MVGGEIGPCFSRAYSLVKDLGVTQTKPHVHVFHDICWIPLEELTLFCYRMKGQQRHLWKDNILEKLKNSSCPPGEHFMWGSSRCGALRQERPPGRAEGEGGRRAGSWSQVRWAGLNHSRGVSPPGRGSCLFSKYSEKLVKYFKQRSETILIYICKNYFGYLCRDWIGEYTWQNQHDG